MDKGLLSFGFEDFNGSLNFENFVDFEKSHSVGQLIVEYPQTEFEYFSERDVDNYVMGITKAMSEYPDHSDDIIEKAKKNLSKLIRKVVRDKNGKKMIVWVRSRNDKPSKIKKVKEQKETGNSIFHKYFWRHKKEGIRFGKEQRKQMLEKMKPLSSELSHINKIRFDQEYKKYNGGKEEKIQKLKSKPEIKQKIERLKEKPFKVKPKPVKKVVAELDEEPEEAKVLKQKKAPKKNFIDDGTGNNLYDYSTADLAEDIVGLMTDYPKASQVVQDYMKVLRSRPDDEKATVALGQMEKHYGNLKKKYESLSLDNIEALIEHIGVHEYGNYNQWQYKTVDIPLLMKLYTMQGGNLKKIEKIQEKTGSNFGMPTKKDKIKALKEHKTLTEEQRKALEKIKNVDDKKRYLNAIQSIGGNQKPIDRFADMSSGIAQILLTDVLSGKKGQYNKQYYEEKDADELLKVFKKQGGDLKSLNKNLKIRKLKIQKAHKNLGKLTRKVITDKNGKRMTVWVKSGSSVNMPHKLKKYIDRLAFDARDDKTFEDLVSKKILKETGKSSSELLKMAKDLRNSKISKRKENNDKGKIYEDLQRRIVHSQVYPGEKYDPSRLGGKKEKIKELKSDKEYNPNGMIQNWHKVGEKGSPWFRNVPKIELQKVAENYDKLSHINRIKFERLYEKEFGKKFDKTTKYGEDTKGSNTNKKKLAVYSKLLTKVQKEIERTGNFEKKEKRAEILTKIQELKKPDKKSEKVDELKKRLAMAKRSALTSSSSGRKKIEEMKKELQEVTQSKEDIQKIYERAMTGAIGNPERTKAALKLQQLATQKRFDDSRKLSSSHRNWQPFPVNTLAEAIKELGLEKKIEKKKWSPSPGDDVLKKKFLQYVAQKGYKPLVAYVNEGGVFARIKGFASKDSKDFTSVRQGGSVVHISHEDLSKFSPVEEKLTKEQKQGQSDLLDKVKSGKTEKKTSSAKLNDEKQARARSQEESREKKKSIKYIDHFMKVGKRFV